jgi:hypothetical protein
MTAQPPRAPAIPQKNALRDNPHLYESLMAIEQWMQQASAFMANASTALSTLTASSSLVFEMSITAPDGVVKTFAFPDSIVTLTKAYINGVGQDSSECSVATGQLVFGAAIPAPSPADSVSALFVK